MNMVLYCRETPNLKLGPGTSTNQMTDGKEGGSPDPGRAVIYFVDGIADFDTDKYPDWEKWVKHPGTPHIEILGSNDQGVAGGETAFSCERHGEEPLFFKTQFALNGHLRSHAPKGVTA